MSTAKTQALIFTPEQRARIIEEHCKGATKAQADLFIDECERRALIPGTHLLMQVRNAKEWDPELKTSKVVKKVTMVTRIDALRLIAQRTGGYEGQGETEYVYLDDKAHPSIRSFIPLPHPGHDGYALSPWAAICRVYRAGFKEPMVATARFDAYAVKITRDNKTVPNDMWARRGPEQLAKCAEALALRKAFPEELAGIYINEEFERDDADASPATSELPATAAPVPAAISVPAVNNAPVEARIEDRPQEEQPAAAKPKPRAKDSAAPAAVDTPEPVKQPEAEAEPASVAADDLWDEPAVTRPLEPNRPPTEEEVAAISGRLREYKAGREDLKNYILNATGAPNTKALTKGQWDYVLGNLDTAAASGEKALNELIFNTNNQQKG